MSSHFDVLVIGAGPAGSSTAYHLANKGVRVLLVDKAAFPRDKTCGDALTPRALHALHQMNIEPAALPGSWPIDGADVVAPNGTRASVDWPVWDGWPTRMRIAPRLMLDDLLVQKAIQAGAEFVAPVHIHSLESTPDGVTITGGPDPLTQHWSARAAIIATGAATPLLIQAGLLKRQPVPALAVRAYFDNLASLVPANHIHFHFDNLPAMPAYGWVFPLSASSANIGLGYFSSTIRKTRQKANHSMPQAMQQFLHHPAIRAMMGAGAKQNGPIKSYPIRMDFPSFPSHANRALIVGEAAGLVNPLSGDGIDFALESGALAASHVANLLPGDDLGSERLSIYSRQLRQKFHDLFRFCRIVQLSLASPPLLNFLVRTEVRHPALGDALMKIVLGPKGVKNLAGRILQKYI